MAEIEASGLDTDPGLDLAKDRVGAHKLDHRAAAVLRRQSQVLLDQQRQLRLQTLRERLHLFRDALLSFLFLLVAAIVVAMVWSAHRSNALVFEPLRAPPQMAADGLDGASLASRLMDKVELIQASTPTARAGGTIRNNWGDDVKLEIPQTGVSVGELNRLLRSALGHETHVTGDLARSPQGLQLVVRTGSRPGLSFSGPAEDLDRLLQDAAEGLFHETQPYLYSAYLRSHHREAEALEVARQLALTGPARERPWAYAGMSDLLYRRGYVGGAAAAGAAAVRLDPELVLGYANWGNAEITLGHDEVGVRALETALRLLKSGRVREIAPDARASWPSLFEGGIADVRRDYLRSAASFGRMADLPDFETLRPTAYLFEAQELALAHQVTRSRRMLSRATDPTDASTLPLTGDWGTVFLPHYAQAAALDDWAGAVEDLEATDRAAGSIGGLGAVVRQTFLWPRLAQAYARLGRVDEAMALAARTPTDCYICLRARGMAAARAGRSAESDAWFTRAVAVAPALPAAYLEWGQARLERNDPAGALRLFASAAKASPNWPEPRLAAGDARLRQGDAPAALDSYRRAVELNPYWGAAHLKAGVVLSRMGRQAEAVRAFRRALALDLSAGDQLAARAGLRAAA